MKNTYKEFESKVKYFCNPDDFEKNKSKLKNIRISSTSNNARIEVIDAIVKCLLNNEYITKQQKGDEQ